MATPPKPQLSSTNNHSGPPILSFSQTSATFARFTSTKSPPSYAPTASSYTSATPNSNNNNNNTETHVHESHTQNIITVVPPSSLHPTTKKRHSENVHSAHITPTSTAKTKHQVTKSISDNNISHISPPNNNPGIDMRPNLSPKHHRKKSSQIKQDFYFYGDLYSVRTKGKLQSKYKVKEKIGTGTFSTVRRGIRRSDTKEIAIKVITKTDLNATEARLIKREIEIMQQLEDHAHIVTLYDIFESAHHLYLVLEYCECGELYDELVNGTLRGWFSERETAHMIAQLAQALQVLHERQIVHRDLKLENILIASKTKKTSSAAQSQSAAALPDFPPSDGDTDYASDFNSSGGRGHARNSTNDLLMELRSDVQQQKRPRRETLPEHDLNGSSASASDSHMALKRRHSEYLTGSQSSFELFRRPQLIQRTPQVEYHLKISDFGLSKKLDEEKKTSDKAMNEEQKQDQVQRNENENTNKSKTFGEGKLSTLYKRTLSGKNLFSAAKQTTSASGDQDNDDARRFMLGTNCGTLYYVAPEILLEEPYNEKVDTWSIGVICFVLLCGSFPFYSESDIELTDLILAGQYELGQTDLHWRKISEAAKDLILKLLTADKVHRLSAAQILQHPFITGKPMNIKRKSNNYKWNAGALFGKLPTKFKNMLDTAKMTFSETDSEYEETSTSTTTLSPNHSMLNKFQFKLNLHSNARKAANAAAATTSSTNTNKKILVDVK